MRSLIFPLTIGLSLLAMPVSAQQQQSASERAFAQKLMSEINSGLQCSAALVTAQDQIAALTKELADEKAKNAKPAEAPK